MLAIYIAVAYIRTGSSIIVTCLLGPIRNAVLPQKPPKLAFGNLILITDVENDKQRKHKM